MTEVPSPAPPPQDPPAWPAPGTYPPPAPLTFPSAASPPPQAYQVPAYPPYAPPPYGQAPYPPPHASPAPYSTVPAYGPPVARTPPPVGVWLILAAGIATVLGSVLPWASVTVFFTTRHVSGTEGDGQFTVALGVGLIVYATAAAQGWRPPAALYVVALLGSLGISGFAALGYLNLRREYESLDTFGLLGQTIQVHIGIGLWIVLAAGLVGAVGAALSPGVISRDARPQ